MTGAVRDWGAFRIHEGDSRVSLAGMPDASVHCCVTSPPYYGLRDYGVAGQIGLEATPDAYVEQMVAVFREVRRVLRDDGTLWLNLGDSYAGSGKGGDPEAGKQATNRGSQSVGVWYGTGRTAREAAVTNVTRKTFDGVKAKDLIGIPWRVAFALQADGWYLRSDIIWHKPNVMPSSVTDRCTTAHEYLFMLSKSPRYYYDAAAIAEPAVAGAKGSLFTKGKTATHQLGRAGKGERADGETRNKRSVWTITTRPFKGAHFATFPPALIEPCILAGAPVGGVVLDPFGGAGTTAMVAAQHGRVGAMCELNPEYADMAERRIATAVFGPLAFGGAAA